MDPLLLLIAAMTFWIKNAAVDGMALAKGKEAPTLERYRTRQQSKKDKLKSPTRTGRQPGPVRQWARALTENASEELVEKSRHKSRRRLAWYRETAPHRDEKWRAKQQRKLQKQIEATERFAQRRGLVVDQPDRTDYTTTATSPDSPEQTQPPEASESSQDQQTNGGDPTRTGGDQSSTDNTNTEDQTTTGPTGTDTTVPPELVADEIDKVAENGFRATESRPDGTARPFQRSYDEPSQNHPPETSNTEDTTTTGANGMYEQVAAELTRSADEIDKYLEELTVFGDGMTGRRWGTEVTGPIADMGSDLAEAAGAYRDLANQIKTQGDAVRDAYDAAPYVPDKDVVMT